MSKVLVDVLQSGAVLLGTNVVCDGYVAGREFRVQTHVHSDHMAGFERSKGMQDIFLSPETRDLLIADLNADLPYRSNLYPLMRGETQLLGDGTELRLVSSNHMLGACQVELRLSDGRVVGYSGDFGWPLDEVIEVEEVVVDSTYGNPSSVRRYTQGDAERRLLDIVSQRLRHGPVHVKAFRGTVERVLHLLGNGIGVPIVATDRLAREIRVYQQAGFAGCDVVTLDSEEGEYAKRQRAYIQVAAKGDDLGNELPSGATAVECSAFWSGPDDPVVIHSERSFAVSLSNHADFEGTLSYVRATGARRVVTDNTKGEGVRLAMAINGELSGGTATPSPPA